MDRHRDVPLRDWRYGPFVSVQRLFGEPQDRVQSNSDPTSVYQYRNVFDGLRVCRLWSACGQTWAQLGAKGWGIDCYGGFSNGLFVVLPNYIRSRRLCSPCDVHRERDSGALKNPCYRHRDKLLHAHH